MLNANSRAVVKYANGQTRVRYCQSTVLPDASESAHVQNINDWYFYLKVQVDVMYRAFRAIDDHVEMDLLLQDVKEHLEKVK